MTNELPKGYEVVEVSDGNGGYEYQVQKIDNEDWCHYSGMPSPKAYVADQDFSLFNDSSYNDVFNTVNEFWADEDAQDSKWGKYKI